MNDIQSQKKKLRNYIKNLKRQQSEIDKRKQSELIFNSVERHETFNKAYTILLYWSMPDEVQTHGFIEKWWTKKNILLPVVDGSRLKVRKYNGTSSMQSGEQFGILEPKGPDFMEWDTIDMIIVPGVAFDKNKNRLGRGRGFYDRLLLSTHAYKLGICFNYQLVDKVPVEEHDFKMNKIISQ